MSFVRNPHKHFLTEAFLLTESLLYKWATLFFLFVLRLLTEFYDAKNSKRRNKFPGKCVHSKLSLKKTLPSFLFLSTLTAIMLLSESGRKLYLKTWLYGTLVGWLSVSITIWEDSAPTIDDVAVLSCTSHQTLSWIYKELKIKSYY